jgi:adenylosuccinate lyase
MAASKKKSISPLDALSPLDGRYWSEVSELSEFASEGALMRTRVEVEARYLIALSDEGVVRTITDKERNFLIQLGPSLTDEQLLQIKDIEKTTKHDVKAVERAMWQYLAHTSLKDLSEYVHFALTSEDVNNLAYRLIAQQAKDTILVPALNIVLDEFIKMAEENRNLIMIARTHGQAAVPTTLGKEIAVFAMRLNQQIRQLQSYTLTGKLNGAVGNFNAHKYAAPNVNWIAFSEKFVTSLGLRSNVITTQINSYEDFAEMFHIFVRVNDILIDFDQDMWRYISDGWLGQKIVEGEVGSSAMPQKVNPIRFENSEGNLDFANNMLEGISRKLTRSRLQRDLSDSTTIRNVGAIFGHCLLAYKNTLNGLKRVTPHAENIHAALHANWAILSEGVQTLLRTKGIQDPYSLIKTLTRGKNINSALWSKWVEGLPNYIDDETRAQLKQLTPEAYIGYACELTQKAITEIKASRK